MMLNCNQPNTKVSEKKDVKVNLIASCKVKDGGGVLVNLPDGSRSTDGDSCCFAGDMQQNYPIIDLDKCQYRIRNNSPDLLPNGCGSEGGNKFPDNPMWDAYQLDESYYSKHSSVDGNFKNACDVR
jgi:hypothetical protein